MQKNTELFNRFVDCVIYTDNHMRDFIFKEEIRAIGLPKKKNNTIDGLIFVRSLAIPATLLALVKLILIHRITRVPANYIIMILEPPLSRIVRAFLSLHRIRLTRSQSMLLWVAYRIQDGNFVEMIDNFYEGLFACIIGKDAFMNPILLSIVMAIIFSLSDLSDIPNIPDTPDTPDVLVNHNVPANNIVKVISDSSNTSNSLNKDFEK